MKDNIFDFQSPADSQSENTDTLYEGDGVLIERIVSAGYSSPKDFWYDQEHDEWIVLLDGEASIRYADGGESDRLFAGDTLLIPANRRHQVEKTSDNPACVWLCVHMPKKQQEAIGLTNEKA